MLGPLCLSAPVYWFTDTKFGGAYGFNTETGPGAQGTATESFKKRWSQRSNYGLLESPIELSCGRLLNLPDNLVYLDYQGHDDDMEPPSSWEEIRFKKGTGDETYELAPNVESFSRFYKERSTDKNPMDVETRAWA